jgi:hypothetical protein
MTLKICRGLARPLFAALLAVALAGIETPAQAAPVADSIGDFSATQGGGGWSYGYFDTTANGAYVSGGFVEFAVFSALDNRWEASEAQVGAQNNVYLSIDPLGGHPNGIGPDAQDANIWAVRRYTSEVDGPVRVDFDLHKINILNTNAGGITGHIFVDGVEVFSRFIANGDGAGVASSLFLNVVQGTLIDFAIDPTGVATSRDGTQSARADGSQFSARVELRALPLPGSAWLLLLGVAGIRLAARPRRS